MSQFEYVLKRIDENFNEYPFRNPKLDGLYNLIRNLAEAGMELKKRVVELESELEVYRENERLAWERSRDDR